MTENRYAENKAIVRAIQEAKQNIIEKLGGESRTMHTGAARALALDTVRIITDGLKNADLEDKIKAAAEVIGIYEITIKSRGPPTNPTIIRGKIIEKIKNFNQLSKDM